MENQGPFLLRGTVLPAGERQEVYVRDGRFTFRPVPGAKEIVSRGWLLPGLVDAHAHLGLNSPANRGPIQERARASARAHLDVGVLLIREPGGPDRSSAGLQVSEGLPRVLTAGRILAPPNGYIPGLAREVNADELPAAAAEEARASGAWAKVVGDFIGPDRRIEPNWSRATLRRTADAVHRSGARIAIHATHPQVIADAIEVGFDSVEHATGLNADHVEAMVEKGTALVPTLSISALIPTFFEGHVSRPGLEEIRRWLRTHAGAVSQAAAQGVTVLAGTDAGMTAHGTIAHEVGLLLTAGLSPEAALGAASWGARNYLGMPGIEEGAPADLIAFEADPFTNLRALGRPALTILDGRIVRKSPAAVRSS